MSIFLRARQIRRETDANWSGTLVVPIRRDAIVASDSEGHACHARRTKIDRQT